VAPSEDDAANILVFGDATSDAAEVFRTVRTKVTTTSPVVAWRSLIRERSGPLNPSPEEYQALARKDLSAAIEEIAVLPLATIGIGKALPLDGGVNPAWEIGFRGSIPLS